MQIEHFFRIKYVMHMPCTFATISENKNSVHKGLQPLLCLLSPCRSCVNTLGRQWHQSGGPGGETKNKTTVWRFPSHF